MRGVVRLISSARSTSAKTGPGMNSNSRVCWSKMRNPVISPGSKSGVHWTRANLPPERLCQGLGQGCLAQARQVFDEQMPSRQQAGQHVLDHLRLAPQRMIRARPGYRRSGRIESRCLRPSWSSSSSRRGCLSGSGRIAMAETGERPRSARHSRQIWWMSYRPSGESSSGSVGSMNRPVGETDEPFEGDAGSPAASPGDRAVPAGEGEPGGRVRPAHRARRSMSFRARITNRLESRSGNEAERDRRQPIEQKVAAEDQPRRGRRRRPAGRRRGAVPISRLGERAGDPFGPGANGRHQLVARRGLDGDPEPVRHPDLGPEVNILSGHRRVPRTGVVPPGRRIKTADDAASGSPATARELPPMTQTGSRGLDGSAARNRRRRRCSPAEPWQLDRANNPAGAPSITASTWHHPSGRPATRLLASKATAGLIA